MAEWLDWHLSCWHQGFKTLQKPTARVGASHWSSWSVAAKLEQPLADACLCILCISGRTDASGSSRGATCISSFSYHVPIQHLCLRFCMNRVGPSCFSMWDRHFFPATHHTFAKCAASWVPTITQTPSILCPNSYSSHSYLRWQFDRTSP